jgi:hypothetical protein
MFIKKFIDDDNRCHAFGHKDIRRCRLERLPEQKTCSIHKNYYKDWLLKNGRSDWQLLTKRQQNEYVYQIENHLIDIPEYYIKNLNMFDTEYFTIIMKLTHNSPSLNLPCLKSCVRKYLFCYCNFPLDVNNREEYCNTLEPYTKNVDSSFFTLSVISDFMIERCIHSNIHINSFHNAVLASYNPRMIPEMSYSYFRCLLFSNKLKKCFITDEIKKKVQTTAPEFIEFYNEASLQETENPINKLVATFNQIHSKEIKKRCAIYKEELIKKVWHPSRIQKLLDMGYDICEEEY